MTETEQKRQKAATIISGIVAVCGLVGLMMGWGIFNVVFKNWHPVARWVLGLATAALLEASITALTYYLVAAAGTLAEVLVCVAGILYGLLICAANAQAHATMMRGATLGGWQLSYVNYFNAAAIYGIILLNVVLLVARPDTRRAFKDRLRANQVKDAIADSKDRILKSQHFTAALDQQLAPVVFRETLREAGAVEHFTAQQLNQITAPKQTQGLTIDALPVPEIDESRKTAQFVNGKVSETPTDPKDQPRRGWL